MDANLSIMKGLDGIGFTWMDSSLFERRTVFKRLLFLLDSLKMGTRVSLLDCRRYLSDPQLLD